MNSRISITSIIIGMAIGIASIQFWPYIASFAITSMRSVTTPSLAVAGALAAVAVVSLLGLLRNRNGGMINLSMPTKLAEPSLTPLEWMKQKGIAMRNGVLDEMACRKALVGHLGPAYLDFQRLPTYARALAAMFALSRTRDARTLAFKEGLAKIWGGPRSNTDRLTEDLLIPILADHKIEKMIEIRASRHAYVSTAMIGLYEWARDVKAGGGVLACAEFLWLKSVDRNLWYALQNASRNTCFIEGAAARAHYLAECAARDARVEPYVEEAIYGLEEYLKLQYLRDVGLEAEPQAV